MFIWSKSNPWCSKQIRLLLLKHFYLQGEVAKLTGKPRPSQPTTGTPAQILQMPFDEPTGSTSTDSQLHTSKKLWNGSLIFSVSYSITVYMIV